MTRDRIRHRPEARLAGKSAEQLGQALVVEAHRGVEQPGHDFHRAVGATGSGQAPRRHRVVMRPHRAVVIAHRIVAALGARQRAHPPSGKHILGEQTLS